jgi:hypothetical protein
VILSGIYHARVLYAHGMDGSLVRLHYLLSLYLRQSSYDPVKTIL